MSGETIIDNLLFQLNDIKCFVFDVDGVFTNGEVLVTESGDLLRTMNTRDGQAVKIALEAGYTIGIITKGISIGVRKRFEMLGIDYIYDGVKDKKQAIEDFKAKSLLKKQHILYMGDDIPDLVVRGEVGIMACPADATEEMLSIADLVAQKNGGQHCVREIIELVMKVQSTWPIFS